MEKLLKMAQNVCDQAEVYSIHSEESTVTFENGKLKNIERAIQSGVTLRIIKDGMQGFSYTKDLKDREKLIQNSINALSGGAEAPATLAATLNIPSLDTWDSSVEDITSKTLANECRRIYDLFKKTTTGQLMATAVLSQIETRFMNSLGVDLKSKSSEYGLMPMLLFPGSFSNISRLFYGKTFFKMPDESLEHMVSLFNAAKEESRPKGGKMKILFLPETINELLLRVIAGTNAQMIFQKQSPLGEKINEKILDETLTIVDNPLADNYPGARAFDDEGTLCRTLPLVENGILKNFYADRLYAGKLGIDPTGHGYKCVGFGDPISFKPAPSIGHLEVEPGSKSFQKMIESIDRGIIPAGVLGGHTGNIPAGDYSLGLSPGLYIEDGRIIGHVKDAMIAGNIYETLNNIEAIENRRHITMAPYGGFGKWRIPAILVNDVSLATKQD